MASRLQQLLEKPVIPVVPTIPQIGGGSRLDLLLEKPKEREEIEIPEVPKVVQTFPATTEMLADLQIDPLFLKENPLDFFGDFWNTLKTIAKQSFETIRKQTEKAKGKPIGEREDIGGALKGVAALGHLAFAPISSFFEAANNIPILGTASKLIGTGFVATGEGFSALAGKIVDELPIPDEEIDLETGEVTHPKQEIKEGVQEIVALAAQIALGKVAHVSTKKARELRTRYGERDAKVIEEKAVELAERAKEPVPSELAEVKPIEIKPEVEVKPKRKFAEVPREQLPIPTEKAEKGVSALEARMKGYLQPEIVEAAKDRATARGLDLTQYERMSKPEQMRAAAKYVEKTSQREVLEVLKGEREAPKGLLHNSIMLALEARSLREKNVNLAIKLASLRSTRAGQEISILTEVEGTSPVQGLNEIIRARRSATTKRLKEGETITSKKSSSVREIKTEQTKLQLKMSEVSKILGQIVC